MPERPTATRPEAARDRIQAVLFDYDGTLADSEPLWHRAEALVAQRFGFTWTRQDALSQGGRSTRAIAATLAERAGTAEADLTEITTVLLDTVAEGQRSGAPWAPGGVPLLVELAARGVPAVIVTGSPRRLVARSVRRFMPDPLRFVIGSEDYVHAKPHPEPYLTAAARLGLAPARCLVLEDSVPGLTAARAAGCAVIAVTPDAETADGLPRLPSLHQATWKQLQALITDFDPA